MPLKLDSFSEKTHAMPDCFGRKEYCTGDFKLFFLSARELDDHKLTVARA